MSKTHLLALALSLVPTLAAAAPPKTLWDFDYDMRKDKKNYTLHAHGVTGTPMTYADAKTAVDANVQRGEWIVDNLIISWPPAERDDLRARATKRGATLVPWDEVVTGTIEGANQFQKGATDASYGLYTKGYPTTLKVDVKNRSPYAVRVTALTFTSCGPNATVKLAKPLGLGANGTGRVSVTIHDKDFLHVDGVDIACPDTGGWRADPVIDYEL